MVSLANFKYLNYLIGLVITVIVEFIMIFFITKRSKRVTPVITSFKFTILCMTLWCIGLIVQIFVINYTTINPMYIDYFIYLPVVLTPVALFFVAITYASYDKFVFKKSYILLFVIQLNLLTRYLVHISMFTLLILMVCLLLIFSYFLKIRLKLLVLLLCLLY